MLSPAPATGSCLYSLRQGRGVGKTVRQIEVNAFENRETEPRMENEPRL